MLAFCENAGMVCCIANKLLGVRATAVGDAARGTKTLTEWGANFVGIEVSAFTFFQLKQLVRTICTCTGAACSNEAARVIEELESHANR